jgi:DNA-directed RNA polymerase subunit beta'
LGGLEPKEELKAKQLEKVIYFAAYLVTTVDADKRHEALQNLRKTSSKSATQIIKDREKTLKQSASKTMKQN